LSLHTALRGFRVTTALAICTALAVSPAVADAAAKKKHPAKKHTSAKTLKEAKNSKPAKKVVVKKPAANTTGLGNTLGLGPTMQLAAMNTAIAASPNFYAGRTTDCTNITAMLASQPGPIMAGNFRDSGGNCYVWLNLNQSSMLTGSEICKTTLHEMGHLTGLQHSSDPADVMFAPFQADPIPAPCQVQPGAVSAKTSAAAICPPGTVNADYCQAVLARVNKKSAKSTVKKHRRTH
jgi:hypothetical protein